MGNPRRYKRGTYGHTLTEPIEDEVASVGDLSTATAEIRVYDHGNIFLSKPASIDEANQACEYEWVDTDLPNEGRFEAEFFITFSGGDVQRVPQVGWILLLVRELDATNAPDPDPPPVFDDHIAKIGAGENPHDVHAEDLSTAESDTDLVLRPDGSGGTTWGSAPSSSGSLDSLTYTLEGTLVLDSDGNLVTTESA